MIFSLYIADDEDTFKRTLFCLFLHSLYCFKSIERLLLLCLTIKACYYKNHPDCALLSTFLLNETTFDAESN